jgi:hypothetical protein
MLVSQKSYAANIWAAQKISDSTRAVTKATRRSRPRATALAIEAAARTLAPYAGGWHLKIVGAGEKFDNGGKPAGDGREGLGHLRILCCV